MAYEIYELRDKNGKKFSWERCAIMNCYDGKFLEWCDLERIDYGSEEINEQLEADGSVIVSRREAELIVKKMTERYVKT